MGNIDKFGGRWTEEKLKILHKYLNFYTTALKNKKFFKKIYVDGFAGEGTVELPNGKIVDGSVLISLNLNIPFDHYYFIEKNPEKIKKLESLVNNFPKLSIFIEKNDANISLRNISKKINRKDTRGVFFIDPFATETDWETIVSISKTECIDLWFLFPFHAINRMLAKNIDKAFSDSLYRCFGTDDWKTKIYEQKKTVQLSIFENESYESDYQKANMDKIISYIKERFESIFPYVAPNPRILKNQNNSIMFVLFFMTANPNQKAINLAAKGAQFILSDKNENN